ncbi:SMEK domain-containing protein [Bacillus toyonensis]|uniref:SMEK domain-containing protein n=1 Tax=Bacillus toyonensis TaxID=155322 RepID=UPI002E226181|nr:SMEK domain-containing protein [Bacillus toyonensis]
MNREIISKKIEGLLEYLAFSLESRGKLALYDLHKYCEDFSALLLNQVYGYNLVNLNIKRFNEPGMDLGDKENKIAIQVTTNKKSKKIKETLEKITDEQKATYECFFVLIVGTKQKKYNIEEELAEPIGFSKDNIFDIYDIIIRVNSLPIEQMIETLEFLRREISKVYWLFESEIGAYLLQGTPTLIFSNCKALVEHYESIHKPLDISEEEEREMEEGIRDFMNAIISLPPATREFFLNLVIKVEYSRDFDAKCISYQKMKRFVLLSEQEYNEELNILKSDNLIDYEEDYLGNLFIVLSGLCSKNNALNHILEFVDEKKVKLEDILFKFDLSAFAIE